jgi:murein DD-endopeptidase
MSRPTSLGLILLILAACSANPPQVRDFATRQAVLQEALGEIGRPYRYGGGDADGFDCSGFVRYVFAQAGRSLPRTAAEQRRVGKTIPYGSLAAGDLVFFSFDGRLHATIYVGDGRIVHAPSSGGSVTVASIDTEYWRNRLVAAVRVLD